MLGEIGFSRDDFVKIDWREVIASTETKICEYFSPLFVQAHRKAQEAGDTIRSQVFLLLHAVSSLHLKPGDKHRPFVPNWQGSDGSRSVDISDFSESNINLLKEIISEIDDPDLRARVGDVIWTFQHKGHFHFAEMAVDAYLQAGESFLLSEEHCWGVDRFTRALHLAASLGRNSGKFGEVIARIESLVNRHQPTGPFIEHFLELLYEYHEGEPAQYAAIAEALAIFDQNRGEWYLARASWNAAARWHRLGKETESSERCLLNQAECYVLEADDLPESSRGMRKVLAARHLQSAIEALRRVPGTESRQNELHIRMLELQASSSDELGAISGQLDLTPQVEKAIGAVKGKSFTEALFAFCMLGSSPRVQNLRDMAEQAAAKMPLMALISTSVLNERGRVVGHRGPMLFGTPEEIEAARIAEMHRWAQFEQGMLGMVVNNARLQILLEHNPEINTFLDITAYSPFVPPDREWIFARGYLAGLQGDFLEALHLLVPQVENSLRYILNSQGIMTSSLSSEGIQEEFDLNVLLQMAELVHILGEDLVFDLQGILISRFGSNFRNLMAHGLLEQQHFYSFAAIYTWWLLLRICCLPLIMLHQEENKDAIFSIK
jgi:hypothetical protein